MTLVSFSYNHQSSMPWFVNLWWWIKVPQAFWKLCEKPVVFTHNLASSQHSQWTAHLQPKKNNYNNTICILIEFMRITIDIFEITLVPVLWPKLWCWAGVSLPRLEHSLWVSEGNRGNLLYFECDIHVYTCAYNRQTPELKITKYATWLGKGRNCTQ